MKWLLIVPALVLIVLFGGACVYSWLQNPRVMDELRQNPEGELAGKVMILTLPSGKVIPVNYLRDSTRREESLRDGDVVYAAADFPWWRELRGEGGRGSVFIQGETLAGHVRAVEDDPALRDAVFDRLRPTAPRWAGTLVVIELD